MPKVVGASYGRIQPRAKQFVKRFGFQGGVLLGRREGDGNIFVVDEHAGRMWLPQRHAPAIVAMGDGAAAWDRAAVICYCVVCELSLSVCCRRASRCLA